MKEELKKWIEFTPAYDKRNDGKGHGIHCVEARWLVKGKNGVIQFVLFTNWFLRDTQDNWLQGKEFMPPLPADIGYHSYKPMYEGQLSQGKCPFIDNKICYYDGSSYRADNFYDVLTNYGGEKLWEALEKEYYKTFKANGTDE